VCRVSAVSRGRFPGNSFPQLGAQLLVITGEAATSRSRSSSILMGLRGQHTGRRLLRKRQGSRSRGEGRKGLQEAGWASEGWASEAGRRRAWRGRRLVQQPLPWSVAGDGAPRLKICGEVVSCQRFLERAAKKHLGTQSAVDVPPSR
jgi:hypothetical protein